MLVAALPEPPGPQGGVVGGRRITEQLTFWHAAAASEKLPMRYRSCASAKRDPPKGSRRAAIAASASEAVLSPEPTVLRRQLETPSLLSPTFASGDVDTTSTLTTRPMEPRTAEEAAEAARFAEIARRAEERAAHRASAAQAERAAGSGVRFTTRREREAREEAPGEEDAPGGDVPTSFVRERKRVPRDEDRAAVQPQSYFEGMDDTARRAELDRVREQYLGGGQREAPVEAKKKGDGPSRMFKSEWDPGEDTSVETNPLYSQRVGVFGGAPPVPAAVDSYRPATLAAPRGSGVIPAWMRGHVGGSMPKATPRRRNPMDLDDEDGSAQRHWSEKPLGEMTERDWRILREDFDIHIRGKGVPPPLRRWEEALLDEAILHAIQDAGYTDPTPIQRATVAIGLQKRDLMGIAETGSGKTAAFVLPMLQLIAKISLEERARNRSNGPYAIVLAPVRELAQQIDTEVNKLGRFCKVSSAVIVGGANIEEQALRLRDGCDILVATPGRLLECLDAAMVVFNQCQYVVLDEADRMIDMGFEPQVVKVLETMARHSMAAASSSSSAEAPSERTTIMFSATMPPEVEKIATTFMRNPAKVRIGDQDTGKNKRISQEVIYTTEGAKRGKLIEVLRRGLRPTIVFANAKKVCDLVARYVEDQGSAVAVIHGDKSQPEREEAIAAFKAGEADVLVATDVAGRGLDIPGVAQVINFDLPSDIERYSHRIGRTGRAGKEGSSTSFFTDGDSGILPHLRSYLMATDQRVPRELESHPAVAGGGKFA
jgi:ATP-dependent RNA helicase DDX23/PRP28